MKKSGFNGYVYDFRADYNDTDVDDSRHSQIFNKKMAQCNKMFGIVKKAFFVGLSFLSLTQV